MFNLVYCDRADIIVRESVKSTAPARGASEGNIGIAGIIGKPTGDIIKVTSMDEAERKLGTHMSESTVMYGLENIFRRLGRATVYVSPVVKADVGEYATVTVDDGATSDPIDIFVATAKFMGDGGNAYSIEISDVETTTYSVTIKQNGVAAPKIKGVTNKTFLSKVEHDDIEFLMLINTDGTTPKAGSYELTGGINAHTGVQEADFDRALNRLRKLPLDFVLVDSTLSSNVQTAISVAEEIRAMAYVNTPVGSDDEEALTFRGNFNGKRGRLMHPHMYVTDPLGTGNQSTKLIPITYNAVACQIEAFRANRGQVSAGMTYGGLSTLGLEYEPDADLLTDSGVNFAMTMDNIDGMTGGTFIWDATTLSNDPDWADLNRIQLLNYIVKSSVPSLVPDLFKIGASEEFFNKIETRLDGFMEGLYKKGEFYGSKDEAYFVQCNELNNPRSEQLAKRVHVKVGYKDRPMTKWIILDVEVS